MITSMHAIYTYINITNILMDVLQLRYLNLKYIVSLTGFITKLSMRINSNSGHSKKIFHLMENINKFHCFPQ
jgi:hypothetical protein